MEEKLNIDVILPVVRYKSPFIGEKVRGPFPVMVEYSGPSTIKRIDLYLDGKKIYRGIPRNIWLNTNRYSDPSFQFKDPNTRRTSEIHTLMATVTDIAGLTSDPVYRNIRF